MAISEHVQAEGSNLESRHTRLEQCLTKHLVNPWLSQISTQSYPLQRIVLRVIYLGCYSINVTSHMRKITPITSVGVCLCYSVETEKLQFLGREGPHFCSTLIIVFKHQQTVTLYHFTNGSLFIDCFQTCMLSLLLRLLYSCEKNTWLSRSIFDFMDLQTCLSANYFMHIRTIFSFFGQPSPCLASCCSYSIKGIVKSPSEILRKKNRNNPLYIQVQQHLVNSQRK